MFVTSLGTNYKWKPRKPTGFAKKTSDQWSLNQAKCRRNSRIRPGRGNAKKHVGKINMAIAGKSSFFLIGESSIGYKYIHVYIQLYCLFFFFELHPWKLNMIMEPKKHPCAQANHLNQPFIIIVFHVWGVNVRKYTMYWVPGIYSTGPLPNVGSLNKISPVSV